MSVSNRYVRPSGTFRCPSLLPALVCLLFCIALIPAAYPANAEQRIRITNGEWPPFLSQKLPHYGFASHVVSRAFAAVGVEVEYGFFPWKRSYRLAKEGKWQGTVVWVYTEERARHFLYSDPVIEDPEYLFHLKQTPLTWKTVQDLKGLVIGATLHTVYPLFEEAEKKGILRLERAGNYPSLYKRLLKKRIDAIPQVKTVGQFLLRTTLSAADQERITFSPTVIQMRRYHLILSKANPENPRFLKLFNQGLKKIKQKGVYQSLKRELDQGTYDH